VDHAAAAVIHHSGVASMAPELEHIASLGAAVFQWVLTFNGGVVHRPSKNGTEEVIRA